MAYVAITRAKKTLAISYSTFGTRGEVGPSRFLVDLDVKRQCKRMYTHTFTVDDSVYHSLFGHGRIVECGEYHARVLFAHMTKIVAIGELHCPD